MIILLFPFFALYFGLFRYLLHLSQWFEDRLTKLDKQFHDLLDKRKEETYQRLEKLNERITNMDMYFEDQKAKILKYIDDRGEELARLLYKFKVRAANFNCDHLCTFWVK